MKSPEVHYDSSSRVGDLRVYHRIMVRFGMHWLNFMYAPFPWRSRMSATAPENREEQLTLFALFKASDPEHLAIAIDSAAR